MQEALLVELYLDAARITSEHNVNTSEWTLTLPKETIIETLLVTRGDHQIDYTVTTGQSEQPELGGIAMDMKQPVTISYFFSSAHWSASHKMLINSADGVHSTSRLEIAVRNDTGHFLKAETIYVVNQHFSEQNRSHPYQMKSYERSEMASLRGSSESNLMLSSPHRIPLATQNLHPGLTRTSINGQLTFQKTYFSFPISEPAVNLPAKFVARLFATAGSPSAEIFFFDMKSLDFLGKARVDTFASGQDRAVDVSLTSKLLASVMIREDINEGKTTKDKLVTGVHITVLIYNMDYFNRNVILTLPARRNMILKNDLKDLTPVDGEFQFEVSVPAMQETGPKYNMRTTTEKVIYYDYWTERRQ